MNIKDTDGSSHFGNKTKTSQFLRRPDKAIEAGVSQQEQIGGY